MVRDPSIVSPTLTGVFIGGGHNKHGTGSRCTLPRQCRPPSPRRQWRCDRSSYKRSLVSRIGWAEQYLTSSMGELQNPSPPAHHPSAHVDSNHRRDGWMLPASIWVHMGEERGAGEALAARVASARADGDRQEGGAECGLGVGGSGEGGVGRDGVGLWGGSGEGGVSAQATSPRGVPPSHEAEQSRKQGAR